MTSAHFLKRSWPAGGFAIVCVAMLSLAVLLGRVDADSPVVRLKLVTAPATADEGRIRLTLPDSERLQRLTTPIVLITDLTPLRGAEANIGVSLNGATVAGIPAGTTGRYDLVLPADRRLHPGDVLVFEAVPGGFSGAASLKPKGQPLSKASWTLNYLEVANVHGTSRKILSFVILPRQADPGSSVSMTSLSLLCLLALAAILCRARGLTLLETRPARVAHRGVAALVAAFFFVLLVTPLVSPYRILLSDASFRLCLLALAWPLCWAAWLWLRQSLTVSAPRILRLMDAALIASIGTMFYVLTIQALLVQEQGNYSALIRIGSLWADRAPFLLERPDVRRDLRVFEGAGYDGEFVYLMAFDPFLKAFADDPIRYNEVADAPPYRYGRIGFSLLTKVFSGDRPELYPRTMVALVVASIFLGIMLLAALAMHYGHSPVLGLLYLSVPGFVQSIHVTLPEPIAAAGLLGGFLLLLHKRAGWAAAALAASLLVRETGAAFVLVLAFWYLLRRDRRTALVIAMALLPLAAWRAYVGWRLFPAYGDQAFFYNAGNIGLPFQGLIDLWRMVRSGAYVPEAPQISMAGFYFPMLVVAGLFLGLWLLWTRRDDVLAAAVSVYGLVAVSLTYVSIWAYVGNGERGTYELFLCLVCVFVSRRPGERGQQALVGAFIGCSALYLWLASVHAPHVRDAVLSCLGK